MSFRQAYGEAGVLHAHFDGEGHRLLPGKAGETGYCKAQGIAQAVVEDDNQQDNAEVGNDGVLAGTDNAGDDEGNGDGGNGGGYSP